MRVSPDHHPPKLVVLCEKGRPSAMERVEPRAEVRYTDAAGLAEALEGADALFLWDFLSDATRQAWGALEDGPDLRWIHIAAAGVDKLMFPELVESDVTVTNSRGIFESSIAEFVLGTILAFAKDFPGNFRLQSSGEWRHRETERITGRTVLIAGTGPIGRATAQLLRAAGMRVSGIGRTARDSDPDFGVVHSDEELPARLAEADYVVALAPLTDRTRGMFDARAFAAMKPTARFINVGRGELVAEPELVEALGNGEIAGAALDVFATEPLPGDSPLWTMPNVLISPHMSGDFIGWEDALAELFADNFERWIAGAELRNIVDKSLGYVPGP
ncbi:D-2-hydroxyacid dehydrogenase [Sciscionella sediminilitoris]|uniref:D-2-hydroxyacid dehydrogenase n=1 Tax=Sciscionella sediminilitoris TaxID=1445613 RepID=UPI000AD103EB